jgi:hypothetical protein
VDDLAVAAGGLAPGALVPLEDQKIGVRRSQTGGHGESHDARSHNSYRNVSHGGSSYTATRWSEGVE